VAQSGKIRNSLWENKERGMVIDIKLFLDLFL
jgi:hypothetical protein